MVSLEWTGRGFGKLLNFRDVEGVGITGPGGLSTHPKLWIIHKRAVPLNYLKLFWRSVMELTSLCKSSLGDSTRPSLICLFDSIVDIRGG